MERVSGLVCSICGAVLKPSETEYICPHEHPNPGNLTVEFDVEKVKAFIEADEKNKTTWPDWVGMWRYRALLPVELTDISQVENLPVGNTPLLDAPDLAKELGMKEVWIKDDGRNPSASLKDRASGIVAFKAKQEKRPIVATASTGNAAAALSGVCASLKQPCIIFVPHTAPEAKRTQLLVYGAKVILVEGCYDDAFDLCAEACKKFGWYCRSTGFNPYTTEGKKTVSFELCEQLYRRHNWARADPATDMLFEAPDYVAVSVGDGNIISGVHKGLKDLLAIGRIKKMPVIIGVQAVGSSVIARAWEKNFDFKTTPLPPEEANTVADSIDAGIPRDPVRAVNAVKETGGFFVQVDDDEILQAIPHMARATGVFAEPAGATTLAGLLKAKKQGLIREGSTLVMINTGNGLKDIVSAKKSVADCSVIRVPKGDIAALEKEFAH